MEEFLSWRVIVRGRGISSKGGLSVYHVYTLITGLTNRIASNYIGPLSDGEMFTLSVRRQEYLMKAIVYGLKCSAVGRTLIRQGSVLGFSANRVWLVSRLYIFYIIFLHYYKARAFSIPTAVRCSS